MRRLFWLAMGITIGVLVMRKLSKMAARLTPSGMAQGLAASLGELAEAMRDFGADVRDAMADREAQLRAVAGLGSDGTGAAASLGGTGGALGTGGTGGAGSGEAAAS